MGFGSAVASILDRWWPAREGVGRCACGAVHLRLKVPGSSYALVDQTTALCHCHDCVGFVKALEAASESTLPALTDDASAAQFFTPKSHGWKFNEATQMVSFYQSDVTVVQGQEHVRALKLTAETPCIRSYCRRCYTPLGLQADLKPLTIIGIYPHVLVDYGLVFPPGLVLNMDSAEPGARDYGGHGLVVRRGMLAPVFILRTFGRIFLGLIFGKRGPGLIGDQASSDAPIPVGLQSIAAETGSTKRTKAA